MKDDALIKKVIAFLEENEGYGYVVTDDISVFVAEELIALIQAEGTPQPTPE